MRRATNGELRLPIRLLWNDDECRLRSPIRIVVGIVLVLMVADLGRRYRPTLLAGDGSIPEAVNTLISAVPQAAGIVLGVVVASLVIDRRTLTDLSGTLESTWWRRFAGGLAIGAGITTLSVISGVVVGYYDVAAIQLPNGLVVWLVLLVATGFSQLIIVIPEELFARGYLITNVTEGLDGLPSIPRGVAAGVGILFSSVVFYATHSARGFVFGLMAGGLAILLGVAYVLSGDLSVPIGIHFGINFAGALGGTDPQPASLVQLTSTTTVAESLVLPVEAVTVRLIGSALGIGLLVWWYRATTGHVRVVSSIARPALRWQRDGDASTDRF